MNEIPDDGNKRGGIRNIDPELLRRIIEGQRTRVSSSSFQNAVSIPDKVRNTAEEKKKELENDALAQDIALKKSTLDRLFNFLVCETVAIFIFALLQAWRTWDFRLEEWSFKLLVAATITQITVMLLVAVKHLFPQRNQ